MVSITPQFETVTWIVSDLDAVTVSAQISRYSDLQVSLEWSIAAEQIFKHPSFNTQKFIRWNRLRGSRTGKEINKVLNYIVLHLNENCGRNLARIYLTRYLNRPVLNAYFWFCWRTVLVENRKHRQCFQLCQINSNFSLCKICWFLKELGLSINIYETFF